ncbi:MAG: hypothetical protein IKR19_07785 [Acholeplasmatales bacterium]|nr:hypothetical protein [Acholeplasmatales bacterium]
MEKCNYRMVKNPHISDMRVWECDNPKCQHIEFTPFKFKDWKFCPYCGREIGIKEGLLVKADVKSTPVA